MSKCPDQIYWKEEADRLLQLQLARAWEGVPENQPTEAEIDRMAADDEYYSEGRIHRPAPKNFHD